MKTLYPSFTARTIKGSGRGKGMGVPTMNLDLSDIPREIREGIYAGYVTLAEMTDPVAGDGRRATDVPSAIHYGPRPVHADTLSFEIHVLDTVLHHVPASVEVHLVEYLRPVMDFASEQALKEQIAEDISRARKILHTL